LDLFNNNKENRELSELEYNPTGLFRVGFLFPPTEHLPRLAVYEKGRALYDGRHTELFQRAQTMLSNTPHAAKLKQLYIAVNLVDIIVHKPSDLMYNEFPSYESGKEPKSVQQQRLNSIVEENDLNILGQEIVTGAGFRGDSFLKTYFNYRQDFSDLPFLPDGVKMESIIEAQDPSTVFPELARGSKKRFKAINIAYVEWVMQASGKETPFLNVERHMAGYIQYKRFLLSASPRISSQYGIPQTQYEILEEVATGRAVNVVTTNVPMLLVQHVPHKSHDEQWNGISATEKIESLVLAINDRLTQIDYVLLKNSDPTAYGADIEGVETQLGGRYIPVRKDEVAPAYMQFNGLLNDAFKQLDILINLVFQLSETPQWLFGTTLGNAGGTGTSHTDGEAIKTRFMPILSKVKRMRGHLDRALRDALYCAQLLENEGNVGSDFVKYEATYPKIRWRDGIPANEKELAQTMQLRTGARPTIDVKTAIKVMDGLDDEQVQEIVDRIEEEAKADQLASPSLFNESATPKVVPKIKEPSAVTK
jgi:hypothetical protein